jgi:hypothetical protein
MQEIILFILTFLLLYLLYQIVFIAPLKSKKKKKKKEEKELLEIRYLKSRYPLDFKKIPENQILQLCAILSCFDMAITVTVVSFVESFLWEIVVGIVVLVLLIVSSYHLVYLFYKKKGMVKSWKTLTK